MKIIFNILSIVMFVAVVFLAYLNLNTSLSFVIWKGLHSSNLLVYHSRFFQVILLVFILGILVGSCWAAAFYSPLNKKLKEYQRKLERTSVQSNDGSARVDVLEAKIEVLEKALQSALEKNNE